MDCLRMLRFGFFLCLLSAIPFSAQGDEPQEKQPAKTADEYAEEFAELFPAQPPTAYRLVRTLDKHAAPAQYLAYSRDGKRLIVGTYNGPCSVWEVASGEKLIEYTDIPKGHTRCVALSPDGKYGLIGGDFNSVHVFDVETGKQSFVHDAMKSTVEFIAVTDDGKWMTAVSQDDTVYRFPLLGGMGSIRAKDGGESFRSYGLSPNGDYAVLGRFRSLGAIVGFSSVVGVTSTSPLSTSDRPMATAVSDRRILIGSNDYQIQVKTALKMRSELLALVDLTSRSIQIPSQILSMSVAGLSTDSRYGVICSPPYGEVEIVDTEFPQLLVRLKLDQGGGGGAISPDGLEIAIGHQDGTIALWRIEAFPQTRRANIQRAAHAWLAEREYAKLDALAQWVMATPESLAGETPALRYSALVDLLGQPALETRDHFTQVEDWLEAAPDSTLAKICFAHECIDAAWAARGSGFANTVSEEGWKTFHERIQQAYDLLKPLVKADDAPPKAYEYLFMVATAQSWDREKATPYAEKLIKAAPEFSTPHINLAVRLLQRWGGRPGESADYAAWVAEQIGGEAGDAAYAQIADGVRDYFPDDRFLPATGFDYQRILKGYLHLHEQAPNNIDALVHALLYTEMANDREAARGLLEKLAPLRDSSWLHDWGRDYGSMTYALMWANHVEKDWPVDKAFPISPANAIPLREVAALERPLEAGIGWKAYAAIKREQTNAIPRVSPQGKLALPYNEEIVLFDPADGAVLQRLTEPDAEPYSGVHFSPDEKFVVGVAGKQIALWSLADGRLLGRLACDSGVSDVAFTADNRDLVIATVRSVTTLALDGERETIQHAYEGVDFTGDKRPVLSRDGKRVAVSIRKDAKTTSVRILSTKDGEQLAETTAIRPIAFLPDGETLILLTGFGVERFDIETGKLRPLGVGGRIEARCAAIDADGKLLLTAHGSGRVSVYDLETDAQLVNLVGQGRFPTAVGFLPEGKGFFVVDSKKEIKFWAAERPEKQDNPK